MFPTAECWAWKSHLRLIWKLFSHKFDFIMKFSWIFSFFGPVFVLLESFFWNKTDVFPSVRQSVISNSKNIPTQIFYDNQNLMLIMSIRQNNRFIDQIWFKIAVKLIKLKIFQKTIALREASLLFLAIYVLINAFVNSESRWFLIIEINLLSSANNI